jgi:hypothetical protein
VKASDGFSFHCIANSSAESHATFAKSFIVLFPVATAVFITEITLEKADHPASALIATDESVDPMAKTSSAVNPAVLAEAIR